MPSHIVKQILTAIFSKSHMKKKKTNKRTFTKLRDPLKDHQIKKILTTPDGIWLHIFWSKFFSMSNIISMLCDKFQIRFKRQIVVRIIQSRAINFCFRFRNLEVTWAMVFKNWRLLWKISFFFKCPWIFNRFNNKCFFNYSLFSLFLSSLFVSLFKTLRLNVNLC